MAFTVADIILDSYQLANVLSIQGNDTLSTVQNTTGLKKLNEILDNLINTPNFSSFTNSLTVDTLTTRELYIGSNLTGSVPAATTFLDSTPFKTIYGMNAIISSNTGTTTNYPLKIFNYNVLQKQNYTKTTGIPKYVYFSTFEDDILGVFNRFLFQTAPSSNGFTIQITGIKMFESLTDDTSKIPATFISYLQYELGFQLAMRWGTDVQWYQTPAKEKERGRLYTQITANNPIDYTLDSQMEFYGEGNNYILSSNW